jgi:hypothetical protein
MPRRRGCTAPPFLTSALDGGDWLAWRSSRFIPGERARGTHWIGGWVDPRAGLEATEKRKMLSLPGIDPRPPDNINNFGRFHAMRVWRNLPRSDERQDLNRMNLLAIEGWTTDKRRFQSWQAKRLLHSPLRPGQFLDSPSSYPVGTWGHFLGSKTAGAWRWPLTAILCRD